MRFLSPRLFLATFMLAALALVASANTSCATHKVDPNNPTPQQQYAKLVELSKLADASVQIEQFARDLQDAEIAAFNTHALPALTNDRHRAVQAGFETFFHVSKDSIQKVSNLSNTDSTRREAVQAEVTAAAQLLKAFTGVRGGTLSPFLVALETAVLTLNLVL
jgi:hypothetical protein